MKPNKVLSIGYVGHREGSRLTRNLSGISSDLENVLSVIREAAEPVFNVDNLFADGALSIRAIGGLTAGSDKLIIKALKAEEISLTAINSASVDNDDQTISEKSASDVSSIINLGFPGDAMVDEGFKVHEEILQSRSDLLIAVWDGEKPEGVAGGTVRAIHNAVHFGIPVIWIHASKDKEPALITRSEGRGDEEDKVQLTLGCACGSVVLERDSLKKAIIQSLLPSDKVQMDKAFLRFLSGENEWTVTNWLWKKAFQISRFDGNKLLGLKAKPEGEENPELTKIQQRFEGLNKALLERGASSDTISGNMANRYRVSVVGLYLLSAFAVFWAAAGYVFQEAFQHFSAEYMWSLPIAGLSEVLVILIIIGWYKWGSKRDWHAVWINSRYLAEMLRMHQLLQPAMGVTPFMYRQDSVTSNWAHWLYRRYAISSPVSAATVDESMRADYSIYLKGYLQGQISYHKKKISSEDSRHKLLHRGGLTLFGFTLLAALIHLFPDVAHRFHVQEELAHTIHGAVAWLTMITIVFPAFGAASHAIMVQEEVKKLITTSEHMETRLEEMKSLLQQTDGISSLRKQSVEAAELMAGEASDWHQMVAFKKLELPA